MVTKIVPYIDGTAKFGWGPEDPVDEGQIELRGVVFTESSGGSPLPLLQVDAVNLTLSRRCLYLIRVYDSCC